MNKVYLLNYISKQLLAPIRLFDKKYNLVQNFSSVAGFSDILWLQSLNLQGSLQSTVQDYVLSQPCFDIPAIIQVNQSIFYAVLVCEGLFYVCGPVAIHEPLYPRVSYSGFPVDEDWFNRLSICTVEQLLEHVLLLDNMLKNPGCSEIALVEKNFDSARLEQEVRQDYADRIFNNQEFGELHNPYDQEIRENFSIEQGDMEQLRKSIQESYTGKLGTLSKNHLRNLKNLGIVVITLASRAAIRGGLSPEISFSLSDSYVQKIEEIKDEPSMLYLVRNAEYHYCELVHELKMQHEKRRRTDQHPRVEHCKNYIFSHLHEKILVSDIAQEMNINSNYLSDIFRQYEGISIARYIMKEKINLAKNLLVYSKYSYIEIASYLGFSSQSHLGAKFRSMTGYTLRQFREKYGIQE